MQLVRNIKYGAAFVAALTLIGCATQLQIVGPYANQLSQSDIQQIKALITSNSNFSHLYTRLEAIRSDKVFVKYGGYRRAGGVYTSDPENEYFTAYKRGGKWVPEGEVGIETTLTVY